MISVVVLASLLAVSLSQAAPPFLSDPDIHGNQIVFTCEGDLWLGDLSNGRTTRLTRDEGLEIDARFSPDGSRIAFSAEYDGNREVYVMPATGGIPRRLTYTGVVGEALEWTPDGRSVLFRTIGPPNNVIFKTVSADGGPARQLPIEFGAHGSYSTRGQLAFTRFARYNEPWYGYQGGMKNDIWVADPGLTTFKKVFSAKGSAENPVWVGDRVCFILGEGEKFSVMSMRADGGDAKRIAGPYDVEVRELSADGNRVVYERGTVLETATLDGEVQAVNLDLTSDLIHARSFRVPAAEYVYGYSPANTGTRVLAESRGQLLSLPVSGKGEARVLLATDGVRYRIPESSPDDRRIAFISDATGEQQVCVADADGSNPRQLTQGSGRQIRRIRWSPNGVDLYYTDSNTHLWRVPAAGGESVLIAKGSVRDGPEFDVSPDSKWVVYSFSDFSVMLNSVYLYSVETGKTVKVSNGRADDFSPVFTKDGRYIAFLSRRVLVPMWDDLTNGIGFRDTIRPYLLTLRVDTPSPFAPEDGSAEKEATKLPFRIDMEGLSERIVEVPAPAGKLSRLEAGTNTLFWLDGQPTGSTLCGYDLGKKEFARMAPATEVRVTADGKFVEFEANSVAQVVPANVAVVAKDQGTVGFGGLQLRIEPVSEWKQMYWEAWRYTRDYFYVQNMHGLNWRAVGEKYAQRLPAVRSRGELDRLFRGMLGELNISHAMITGGRPRYTRPRPAASFLGIDVEVEPSGAHRITMILKGDGINPAQRSPLAEPGLGVKVGDYLLEVAGAPVGSSDPFMEALVGRTGETVSVLVNDTPTREGARRFLVKPIASEFRLRYLDWVDGRRKEVDRLSNNQIAYVHLLSMTHPEMSDFLRQYLPARNKQALMMDLRHNTGGFISNLVMGHLRQRVAAYFNLRANDQSTTRQVQHFDGPMLVMVNEFTKSNGEEFPHQFRHEGLGKIIGRRTWGGEVGSDPGWPLVDGGKIWVPNYGAWTPKDGWIIEGVGITPDIDVENDPNAFVRGRDVQLERGVKELLEELAKNPPVRPKAPTDPVRVGGEEAPIQSKSAEPQIQYNRVEFTSYDLSQAGALQP